MHRHTCSGFERGDALVSMYAPERMKTYTAPEPLAGSLGPIKYRYA
jgi:hypothetical protein